MRRISVVGFGKIGQAVVANLLRHQIQVNAVDINPALNELFASGNYSTNEPELEDILVPAYRSGQLTITHAMHSVSGSDAIIVAIPLLVSDAKEILDTPFLDCFRAIAPHVSSKTLIVVETSIPVGYGRKHIVPAMEAMGAKHGEHFLLVHSPERIKSGSMLKQLLVTPKVIGGVSQEAADRAREVYQWFFDSSLIHTVQSIESAEMVKLAGMAYRDVNIALSNQLAQFAHQTGVEFAELIPLINTDGEAHMLQPGIGVGGHCTPVYPYFLINNFREAGLDFMLAARSREINDGMAEFAVQCALPFISKKTALILGLGFRPDIKEDTFSTSYLLHKQLIQHGFASQLHDTVFNAQELEAKGFEPCEDIYATRAAVLFLVTMHEAYQSLDFERLAKSGVEVIVDGRNQLNRDKMESSGIRYIGIGRTSGK
ncbi:MAG: nucleotide sugar dehydrogenase [Flavobacteriales bacterium]